MNNKENIYLTKAQRAYFANTVLPLETATFGRHKQWCLEYKNKEDSTEYYILDYDNLTWSTNDKEKIAFLDDLLLVKFLDHMAKGFQMTSYEQMQSGFGIRIKQFFTKFLFMMEY